MRIKTIATGSSGNAYILTTSQGKHLLLDAGLTIKEIKQGLDFDIGNVDGCIVTHKHTDHSKSASKLQNMGIRVFRPYFIMNKFLKTQIGEFTITTFDVPHNGIDNRAVIIKADGETILYATDFEYIPYKLREQRFTAMLVECNYQADRITTENGHRDHVFLGHCELSTCRDFVAENVTDALKTIILIHPSQSGGLDKARAVNEIQAVAPGTKVYMAEKGLTVDI